MIVSSGDGKVNSVDSAVSAFDRLIRPRRRGQKTGSCYFSDRRGARGLEGRAMKQFHLALGVSDVEASPPGVIPIC